MGSPSSSTFSEPQALAIVPSSMAVTISLYLLPSFPQKTEVPWRPKSLPGVDAASCRRTPPTRYERRRSSRRQPSRPREASLAPGPRPLRKRRNIEVVKQFVAGVTALLSKPLRGFPSLTATDVAIRRDNAPPQKRPSELAIKTFCESSRKAAII